MTRAALAVGAVVVLAVTAIVAWPASAALREVTVGNYYFSEDGVGNRQVITARQGDQLRFTVREGDYPPHSVQVDELGISSPDLLLFETYTTPPLERPGEYRLYCRAHENRDHQTRLVVQATSTTTTAPSTTTSPTRPGTAAPTTAEPSTTSTVPVSASVTAPPTSVAAAPAPAATVPSGVGVASDRRRAPAEPGSLADVLGRDPAGDGPWTRSLRQGAVAAVVLIDIAIAAVLLGRRREERAG